MMSSIVRKCETCMFHDQAGMQPEYLGKCKRKPPVTVTYGDHQVFDQPTVDSTKDYCFEWVDKDADVPFPIDLTLVAMYKKIADILQGKIDGTI